MIISKVRLRNYPEDRSQEFPWNLDLIKNFSELDFTTPIAFFVGENGSGKSTILEGIAAYTEVPMAGGLSWEEDGSLSAALELARYLSIRYDEKTHHGFFVRAEDFIGFSRKIKEEIRQMDADMAEIVATFEGGDLGLALGPLRKEKEQFIKRYSTDLEAMSHGEGFLKFFTSRITSKGLYLIDEPEAALSPSRQLSLLALMLDKVKTTGSQFIIATHSPIMMSAPLSEVFYFDEGRISKIPYQETAHYRITKSVLDNPEDVMKEL